MKVDEQEVQQAAELMRKREIVEAFKLIELNLDEETVVTQNMLMELVRWDWNLFLLAEDEDLINEIRRQAEMRDPWMGYVYARYHDAVMPETNSLQIATDYYDAAIEYGIADAMVYEAMSWRDGEYGVCNVQKYHELCDKALDKGSVRAVIQISLDRIYGNSGYQAQPQHVFDTLVRYVDSCDADGTHYDPYYMHLLGRACEETGKKQLAAKWYERAMEAGDAKSCYPLALLRACDENGNIIDIDAFSEIMERGRAIYAPTANLEVTLAMTQDMFDDASEEDQQTYHELIKDELELGALMGERMADYILAIYYRDGLFGFDQDYNEAFRWAARGALLRDDGCYGILADMIRDGIAPGNRGEEFQHYCELQALRYGSNEYMERVVEAYQHGHLTDYAAEIEQYYLPQIEEE